MNRPNLRARWLVAALLVGCGSNVPHDAATDSIATDGATDVRDAGDAGASDAPDGNDGSAGDVFDEDASLDAQPSDGASDGSMSDGASTDASDASADTGTVGTPCTSDAMCGAGFCVLGHCGHITDEMLPTASVPSPDRCRLAVGVDYPSGSPLRVISVVAGSTGDTGYESSRVGTSWTQTTLATNVGRYTTPRFRRAMTGALDVDFVQGVTVYLGSPYGSVMESMLSDYAAAYGPSGELVVLTKYQGTGTFSYPYPLRMWRQSAGTWMSDLVSSSIGTDGMFDLHFRSDSTPDVLVYQTAQITLYRKALDVWTGTPLFTGPGDHAAGAVTLHDPAGGSQIFFGTYSYPTDPSVGDLFLDYLHVASDGTIARHVALPVGGHGYSLRAGTLDSFGNAYAMVVGPASGGRYPTYVIRVSPTDVTSSVVANFETTVSACSLAVTPDQSLVIAAYQGYMLPVLLRTIAP